MAKKNVFEGKRSERNQRAGNRIGKAQVNTATHSGKRINTLGSLGKPTLGKYFGSWRYTHAVGENPVRWRDIALPNCRQEAHCADPYCRCQIRMGIFAGGYNRKQTFSLSAASSDDWILCRCEDRLLKFIGSRTLVKVWEMQLFPLKLEIIF